MTATAFITTFTGTPSCTVSSGERSPPRWTATAACSPTGKWRWVSGLESHAYTIRERADIAYFHIGTTYTEPFRKIYGGTPPARWLTDEDYNRREIYPLVEKAIRDGGRMSELEKVSYANLLLARIIERYGVSSDRAYFVPKEREDSVSEIVQYIYDHSDEDLNLKSGWAQHFCCAPQSLSRKLSKYIKTDLRVFINDVRAQKVMQLDERRPL